MKRAGTRNMCFVLLGLNLINFLGNTYGTASVLAYKLLGFL